VPVGRDSVEGSADHKLIMTSLSIPESDLPVFKRILELTDSQVASLTAALSETNANLKKSAFVNQISKKVENVDASDISSILRVLFILYRMKDRTRMSVKELAEGVSNSVSKGGRLSAEQIASLSERIQKLLAFDDTISVTAKAMDVMTEHAHVFCNARILSDIRPVFSSTAESAAAAVVIHTLQIGYHDGGTGPHKEFYVALDSADVGKLKEVILRAEKKDVALQTILKTSHIPYLET
jgi:hypothetical protein